MWLGDMFQCSFDFLALFMIALINCCLRLLWIEGTCHKFWLFYFLTAFIGSIAFSIFIPFHSIQIVVSCFIDNCCMFKFCDMDKNYILLDKIHICILYPITCFSLLRIIFVLFWVSVNKYVVYLRNRLFIDFVFT